MNNVLLIVGLLGASFAFAESSHTMQEKFQDMSKEEKVAFKEFMKEKSGQKSKKIEDVKIKILNKLDDRIDELESAKKCVNAATSHDELKSCKPKKEERESRMEERESRE